MKEGEEKEPQASPRSIAIPSLAPGVWSAPAHSPVHRLPRVSVAGQSACRDPQQRGQKQRAQDCHGAEVEESVLETLGAESHAGSGLAPCNFHFSKSSREPEAQQLEDGNSVPHMKSRDLKRLS